MLPEPLRHAGGYMEQKPLVWVIDRQQWARVYIRAELMERGYDVDGFEEVADAVAALRNIYRAKPLVMVLELAGLEPKAEELDILIHSGIGVIALAGEMDLNKKKINAIPWPHLLRRPFSIGEVADAVDKLVGNKHG
jgi:hypothetical protein